MLRVYVLLSILLALLVSEVVGLFFFSRRADVTDVIAVLTGMTAIAFFALLFAVIPVELTSTNKEVFLDNEDADFSKLLSMAGIEKGRIDRREYNVPSVD